MKKSTENSEKVVVGLTKKKEKSMLFIEDIRIELKYQGLKEIPMFYL